MLKLFWILVSFFIIIIILARLPEQSAGLASFATKSDILGSPVSAKRYLNIVTALAILIYVSLAVIFNLS